MTPPAIRLAALALLAATAVLVPVGCKSSVPVGQYTVTIDAPATVNRGEKLYFTATLKDAGGSSAPDVVYQYKLIWTGVESTFHRGKSGVQQKINVKGAPGTASVIIYGSNAQGYLIEIGWKEFKVE